MSTTPDAERSGPPEPWARPIDGRGPDRRRPDAGEIVEVELVGSGPITAHGRPDASGARRVGSRWRRLVGLSSLAGVVLGAVIAVVWLATDDEPDSAAERADESTGQGDDAPLEPTSITAPPTLPPVQVLGDGPTIDLSWREYDTVAVDVAPGEFELDVDAFELERSVTTTMTVTYLGGGGYTNVVAFDSATGRAHLRETAPGNQFELIIDTDAETVYMKDGDMWRANAIAVMPSGLTVDDFVRAMVAGPIRHQTIDADRLISNRYVMLETGELVREFSAFLVPQQLPEWAAVYDRTTGTRPGHLDLDYKVYVTRDGLVRRTQGLNATSDGGAVLTIHTFDRDSEVDVLGPDPATVIEIEARTAAAFDAAEHRPPV